MNRRVEISAQTILLTLALILGIWLFVQIRDILYLVFIAFLLMTAMQPLVTFLERLRIPKIVSILLVYLVVFGFLGVSIGSAIPQLVVQTSKLVQALPGVVREIMPHWNIDIATVTQQIAPLSENIISVTVGIFSNIFAVVTVLVFSFYFLLERRHAQAVLTDLFGESFGQRTTDILRLIEIRLGAWVRGELLLMTFVGVLVYIGLTLLGINYALPLAILSALLELVPLIGPNMSAIPGILLALAISPWLALLTAGMYFMVQQIENNIFVPLIMRKSVGLSPIITIFALLVGARLGGITGAVLAVPAVLVGQVLITLVNTKNPSK